ncbi:tautomerase family protein [Herbaspirillum sp. ST 5-3]|uniref:tautomerase family protein n=1 Tax=Herbaspirillum sp. ST 5-3 TaxID=2567936 RepID=UPI0010A4982E|nr:tautomerase family protein [Herbaspirillum sp. ST 5-3]
MPVVRVNLREGKNEDFRRRLSNAIHQAMVDTINVPPADKFQIITEHGPGNLAFPDSYLGIPHEDEVIFVQIFLNAGRTIELKQALYRALAAGVEAIGFNPKDLIINLVEVRKEDWSFGNGVAQYVPPLQA